MTLETDAPDVGGFMESLFARFNIRDISVKEPPMEEIIGALYL